MKQHSNDLRHEHTSSPSEKNDHLKKSISGTDMRHDGELDGKSKTGDGAKEMKSGHQNMKKSRSNRARPLL